MLPSEINYARAQRVARRLAEEHRLLIQGELLDGSAAGLDYRPLYNPPPDYPEGWWVGIATQDSVGVIRSSVVIGVSKTNGVARILGDAGDEG